MKKNQNVQSSEDFQERIASLEKKCAEQQKLINTLDQKVQLYEHSANATNEGFWDLNLLTNVCYVSKSWNKMLGYENLFEVSDWEKLIHPEDFERVVKTIDTYKSGNSIFEEEFRIKHKDGSYRWVLSKASLLYNKEGIPYRLSGSNTDITAKKKSDQEIQNSEKRYKNLFENSMVGMLRVNFKDGNILEANRKALQMFKLENTKFPIYFRFFKDEGDRSIIYKMLKEDGVIENFELKLVKNDGTEFWATFSASMLEKEDHCECVLKDISETKENLLELQKVNFELDNFVYHASHDLRSPLRSVLGLVDILRLETDDKEKSIIVEMIEGSIKRLDRLVKDLLSISRNNRVNDPFENVNFMLEINNSLSSVYHIQDIRNFEVITKVFQKVPFYSDLTRIRIVLNNLLSNAIKYRSYDRERSFVDIEVKVSPEKALIIISDNGEGIPDEKKNSVFEMFVRASESSEGSGLGLYIVKNVLEKLNGSITMESTFHVGTTFTIIIPNGTKEDKLS